ncbi:MAG: ankyrin repeat domain-containing protein [Thermodesulfovibrionales bacterium]
MRKKGNLISLISVLFILLVSMAMGGCATVTQLGTAAHGGDIREVEALLNKGVDVNERVMGTTPLLEAVFYKCCASLDIIRLLLDKGADPNLGTSSGWKPIHYAVDNGNVNVVKLLLDRGADITVRNHRGKTPLKMAEEEGQTVIARMLREAEENQYKKLYAKDEKPTPSVPEKSSVSTPKSDVDELPLVKAKPNKNAYAIVIGIENYRQKLPKADYAVADAKTVTEYLTKAMGYPEENVVTLTNDRASLTDFIKYFEKWLPNNVEKDSSVFIYYSGHGAPNTKTGDAYLVPYDGDPSFIEQTGYPLKKLYESLNKLQAKEIIVALDSCFSGAGGKSVIAKGARPLVMNLEQDMKAFDKLTVLSAASGEQTSSTYDEKGHGLFTYFMLKGIKDENVTRQDGSIKMDDLFGYIKPQVERIARKQYNNEQTPQLFGGKPR